LGKGFWGYHLSNFLNVLDPGQISYMSQLGMAYPWYRKKHGRNPYDLKQIKEVLDKKRRKTGKKSQMRSVII